MRDEFCECPDCRPDPAEVKALRARVAELEALVREADEALLWAKSRSPEAAMTMVKEASAWQARARAALAPRSERREGEP